MFQSDGTFVGKFGTMGSGEGQLVSFIKRSLFTQWFIQARFRNILTISQFPIQIGSLSQTQTIIEFRYDDRESVRRQLKTSIFRFLM